MFTVVAPASMTASTTCVRKSSSVREASSGENSTSSQNSRAVFTPSTATRMISSCAMFSLNWRWMALVARNTWMRRCGAGATAFATSSMSPRLQRARPQMMGPCTSRATALTLSQSPREAAGNPASMTSTPRSASARATRSFSGCAMLQPGDCSPSRSVVSKIITRSRDMGHLALLSAPALLQPRHARTQLLAHGFELVIEIRLHEAVVFLAPVGVLLDPLLGELALLDLLENLAHLFLGLVVDDARAAREIAVLGGVGDEFVHLRQAAFVQQVDDELQLVQALVVRDFGLITGFHQRFETLEDQVAGAAAEHGLFAEQIRFGLFSEGGLEHATAGAADAVAIGQRLGERIAARILVHRDQRRYAATLLVLAAHEIAGTFGRDQHHVEILARLDLLEMNVKAVGEQQRGTFLQRVLHLLVQIGLREVGHQHGHEIGVFRRFDGLCDLQSIAPGLLPAVAVLAHADHHVVAAVREVQRMGAALAAVAQDGDPGLLQRFLVYVFARIQLGHCRLHLLFKCSYEKPR